MYRRRSRPRLTDEDFAGGLRAVSAYSVLTDGDVAGGLHAVSAYSVLTDGDVAGGLHAVSAYSVLTDGDIAGGLRAVSAYSVLTDGDVAGGLRAVSAYSVLTDGDIAGGLHAVSAYSVLTDRDVAGGLHAVSAYSVLTDGDVAGGLHDAAQYHVERVEVVGAKHHRRVARHRREHRQVRLRPDADRHHRHAGGHRLARVRHRQVDVDRRHAVGDDERDVGRVVAVTVLRREHVLAHEPDAARRVRRLVLVLDPVDGRQQVALAAEVVQVEVQARNVAERDDAEAHLVAAGQHAPDDALHEVEHLAPVLDLDAARRVEHEHHVGHVAAGCKHRHPDSDCHDLWSACALAETILKFHAYAGFRTTTGGARGKEERQNAHVRQRDRETSRESRTCLEMRDITSTAGHIPGVDRFPGY